MNKLDEINIVTRTYQFGQYNIDLVIENNNGHLSTDVWISKDKGVLKLFMFRIKDKCLDDVIKIVETALNDDDTYTSNIDKNDSTRG